MAESLATTGGDPEWSDEVQIDLEEESGQHDDEALPASVDPEVKAAMEALKSSIHSHPHKILLLRIIQLLEEEKLTADLQIRTYQQPEGQDSDAIINEKNRDPGSVFLLYAGAACISKTYEKQLDDDPEGPSVTASGNQDVLNAPQIFGEMAHILGSRTATVAIFPDAALLEIPKGVFKKIMQDPVVKVGLMRLIAGRLMEQAAGSLGLGGELVMSLKEGTDNTTEDPNKVIQKPLGQGAFGIVSAMEVYGNVEPSGDKDLFPLGELPTVTDQVPRKVVKILHPENGFNRKVVDAVNQQLLKERALQVVVNRSVREPLEKDNFTLIRNRLRYKNEDKKQGLDIANTTYQVTRLLLSRCIPVNPELVQRALERFEYMRVQKNKTVKIRDLCRYILDSCGTVVPEPHEFHAPFMKVEDMIDGVGGEEIIAQVNDLSEEERIAFALGTAQAIEAVNRAGVIHRDFKPENMLIDTAGVPRIIDLGISHQFTGEWERDENYSETINVTSGTLLTMTPEQARGIAHRKSDVFAYGCMLYKLYATSHQYPLNIAAKERKLSLPGVVIQVSTGNILYDKYVTEENIPDPKMRLLIAKMLSYNPNNRPTMRAVRKEILQMYAIKEEGGIEKLAKGYHGLKERVSGMRLSEGTLEYHPENSHMKEGKPIPSYLAHAQAFLTLTDKERERVHRWMMRSHQLSYRGVNYAIDVVRMDAVVLRDQEKKRISIPWEEFIPLFLRNEESSIVGDSNANRQTGQAGDVAVTDTGETEG